MSTTSPIEEQVPIISFSSSSLNNNENVRLLNENFNSKYKSLPNFYVRVPGRVNLIGEHVDYCGYAVFPMAIQKDIILGLKIIENTEKNQSLLYLSNVKDEFEDFNCRFSDVSEILKKSVQKGAPKWYLYFLCGIQGILEFLPLPSEKINFSIQISVCGSIPPSAGLSSSSALVCSAALALLSSFQIHNKEKIRIDRKEIANLCAKSERYIGTEGGGMDQAIEMLATAGTAQLIEFMPTLKGEKIQLPPNAIFIIANSLAPANKAASFTFNIRVSECRLATWLMAKKSNVPYPEFTKFQKLKELQDFLKISFSSFIELISETFHENPYSAQEISQKLDISIEELEKMPLLSKIPFKTTEFKLFQRASHVIQEAERVYEFKQVSINYLENSKLANVRLKNPLIELGALMKKSHESLKNNYECSHPLLDSLVKISEKFSYGARLTGAGFGGCIVALLDKSQVENYMKVIKEEFYKKVHGIEEVDDNILFITQPGDGASIITD